MEIISRGTPPSEKIHKIKCNNCNSLIQFTEGEGKIVHDQRDGNSISIICPVCGKKIWKDL